MAVSGRLPHTAASGRLRSLATLTLIGVLGAPWAIAVSALGGEEHRWVDILAQFTAPALIGAVLVALVALVLRLWTAFGAGLAVILLAFMAGAAQWFPARGWPQPDAPVVTLYFANLHMINDDVPAIARSIAEANADIVVLVELSDHAATRIEDILGDYPYRAIERRPSGQLGDRITIASRRPLTAHAPTGIEPPYVSATVQTAVGPIDVVGVHLTRPWPYQYQWAQILQARALTPVIQDMQNPVLMAGDFNSVSSARIGRQIQTDMKLTAAPGWPGTWPAAVPSPLAVTIDQIYHGPDLAVLDRRLGRPTNSDHRPVIVRLTRALTHSSATSPAR